jgi:hypothetical protein
MALLGGHHQLALISVLWGKMGTPKQQRLGPLVSMNPAASSGAGELWWPPLKNKMSPKI